MNGNGARCPHCGGPAINQSATPDGQLWALCGSCGKSFHAGSAPRAMQAAAASTAQPKKRGALGCLLAFPGSLGFVIPMVVIFCPRACASIDDSHQVALDALRACPRAHEVLGEHIDAAWIGMHTGESSTGGSSGSARWSFAVSGSRGRGDYDFSALKQGGVWRLTSATLTAGGQTFQVPSGCSTGNAWPGVVSASSTTTSTSTTTAGAPAGACDRMQRCCDTPAGRSQHLTQICATVPLVRTTPNAETTCQQLFDSAGRLIAVGGGAAPPECQP